jgi:hypothetical protein
MLNKKIKAYEKDKTSLSTFSLIKELPKMKKSNFDWLKEVDSTVEFNSYISNLTL